MTSIRNVLWLTAAGALSACGGPTQDGALPSQRVQQVAQSVARGEDRASVQDLARWIIEGRKDFLLVDIRPADAFAAGHIQGAENVALTELVTPARLADLPAGRKVVVYSTGSQDAAAGATLLRLAGHEALAVTGGYDAWSREVLNPPEVPAVATVGEPAPVAEKRAIACYFVGGQGSQAEAPVYAPKPVPVAPAPAAAAPAAGTGGLILREGC
jgi:hypothetical protein